MIPTKAVPYQTYLSNLKSDPNATLALTARRKINWIRTQGKVDVLLSDIGGFDVIELHVVQRNTGWYARVETFYEHQSFGSRVHVLQRNVLVLRNQVTRRALGISGIYSDRMADVLHADIAVSDGLYQTPAANV